MYHQQPPHCVATTTTGIEDACYKTILMIVTILKAIAQPSYKQDEKSKSLILWNLVISQG